MVLKSQDYKISTMAHPLTRVAVHHLTPAHWAGAHLNFDDTIITTTS